MPFMSMDDKIIGTKRTFDAVEVSEESLDAVIRGVVGDWSEFDEKAPGIVDLTGDTSFSKVDKNTSVDTSTGLGTVRTLHVFIGGREGQQEPPFIGAFNHIPSHMVRIERMSVLNVKDLNYTPKMFVDWLLDALA